MPTVTIELHEEEARAVSQVLALAFDRDNLGAARLRMQLAETTKLRAREARDRIHAALVVRDRPTWRTRLRDWWRRHVVDVDPGDPWAWDGRPSPTPARRYWTPEDAA